MPQAQDDLDIDSLLINNDLPPPESLEKASQSLAGTREGILEIEAQINALNSQLSSLKAQALKYESITSHFRCIPDDLLREIFFHCLPSFRNPFISTAEAPLLLTRVCRRWRTVVLASPLLWSRLHITFCDLYRVKRWKQHLLSTGEKDTTPDDEIRQQKALDVLTLRCEAIRKWLSRSGTCELSISIFYSSTDARDVYDADAANFEETEDLTTTFLQTLLPFLPRCRQLEVRMPRNVCQILDILMADMAIDLTALRDLNITFLSWTPFDFKDFDRPWQYSIFQAHNLRSLSLGGFDPKHIDMLTARYEHLTRLSCNEFLHPEDNIAILKNCRNLIHCKISVRLRISLFLAVPGSHLPSSLPQVVVFLPQLLSLTIAEDDSVWNDQITMRWLYSSIDAPILEWLNYENKSYFKLPLDSNEATPVSPILPLLQKSTRLSKLSLDPRCFLPEDARKAFDIVSPSLRHLVMGDERSLRRPDLRPAESEFARQVQLSRNYPFLEWFTVEVNSSPDPLFPHLRVLESFPGMEKDETLLQFVKSRLIASSQGQVARMKLVRVKYGRTKQLDVEDGILEFLRNVKGSFDVQPPKLDLKYLPDPPRNLDRLSTSYGLDENEQYWKLSETNEMYMPDPDSLE